MNFNFSAKDFLTKQLEDPLRQLLNNQLERIKSMPELLHGTLLMSAAGNFQKTMIEKYDQTSILMALNGCFVDEKEFATIIQGITNSVLSEYVKLPSSPSKEEIDESHYTFKKEWFEDEE